MKKAGTACQTRKLYHIPDQDAKLPVPERNAFETFRPGQDRPQAVGMKRNLRRDDERKQRGDGNGQPPAHPVRNGRPVGTAAPIRISPVHPSITLSRKHQSSRITGIGCGRNDQRLRNSSWRSKQYRIIFCRSLSEISMNLAMICCRPDSSFFTRTTSGLKNACSIVPFL